MVLISKEDKFSIENISSDELTAIYNAIISSSLKDRRSLYQLKTEIENIDDKN